MRLFNLLMILFSGASVGAQQTEFVFRHLKEKDGLSHNVVNAVLKDRNGMVWFGSKNGLNRFDGFHFYTFQKTKSPPSIIDNNIYDLCESVDGKIWGATSGGIFCYDGVKNQFNNFKLPHSMKQVAVQNIICDKRGVVWANSEYNILHFDSKRNEFVEALPLSLNKDSLRTYGIRKNGMLEDPNGKGLWFASRRGLFFYHYDKKKYFGLTNNAADDIFNGHSYGAIANASSGKCWVFDNTTKHAVLFDPVSFKIIKKLQLPVKSENLFASLLFEDSDGRLWIGTWFHGNFVLDINSGEQISRLQNRGAETLSLPSNFLWDAMEDTDKGLWFCTNGGVSRTNPGKMMYKVYPFSSIYPDKDSATINWMAEDPIDKNWWINFDYGEAVHYSNNKVIRYNSITHQKTLYNLDDAPSNSLGSKSNGLVRIVFNKDTVLLCSGNGIWYLTKNLSIPKPYEPLPLLRGKTTISTILMVNDSITFLGNATQLFKWNRRSGTLKELTLPKQTLLDGERPSFHLLQKHPDGNIWFSAGKGYLGYINSKDELIFEKILTDDGSRVDAIFSSLQFYKKEYIWISTKGEGIYSYHIPSKTVRNYTQSDGLPSDDIHVLMIDSIGNVWSMSNNKFSVRSKNTERFTSFTIPLSESFYNYNNQSFRSSAGSVFSTMHKYLIEFIPTRMYVRPVSASPVISMIRINGKDSLISPLHDQPLELKPQEKSLTFTLGMLTDINVFPYHFEYMLQGIDDSMQVAPPSAEIVYNNISPGKYTLKVLAVAKNKSWKSKITLYRFEIHRPYYSTIWFRLMLLSAIIGSVYYLFHRRQKQRELMLQLETKAQLLEKEKAMVMYENLKQHLNPHFLFNSLTSLSSLIRIEPLMAIHFLDKISKVYRYILKNRDVEVVPLAEELKFVNIYIDLQQTRFEDALQVKIDIPADYLYRKIAPVTLQNLVENSIKHNIANTDTPLIIEIFVENDYIVVRNNLQKKNFVETSNQQGLNNMVSLYKYLSRRPMFIVEDNLHFTVKVPLINE